MQSSDYVQLRELYALDYELTDIYAERQKWIDGVLFRRERPRKSTGLIFLNGCTGEYSDSRGSAFFAPCKSLVCLPAKSRYSVLNISSQLSAPDAYLIEFNIVQNNRLLTFADAPFLVRHANSYYAKRLTEHIVQEYETLMRSPAVLKSLIYEYLAFLGKEASLVNNKKCLPIAPAVEFMEQNPAHSLPVSQLAKMCSISEGCFRRLFREYTGKSPLQYIIDAKLDLAQKLLENSNTSVEQIAQQLEFESSAYFCRLFKEKLKLTPTEYRNNS